MEKERQMPAVKLSVNQDRIEINRRQIRKTAKKILSVLDCSNAELSIVIVDDEEMADLNWEYRQVDSSTDVLSFPMREGEFGDVQPDILGDIVVSAPTAQVMAQSRQISLQEVMDLLLVHGVLHLLGYDHADEDEARLMDEKTLEVLRELGYSAEAFSWYLTADQHKH
jgi:probable rRNA maturation factor